jgi:hypothetical protein
MPPSFAAADDANACQVRTASQPGLLSYKAWTTVSKNGHSPVGDVELTYARFGREASIVASANSPARRSLLISWAKVALESCIALSNDDYREYKLRNAGPEQRQGTCIPSEDQLDMSAIALHGGARTLEYRFKGYPYARLERRGTQWTGEKSSRLLGPIMDCNYSGALGSCAKDLGWRTITWSFHFEGADIIGSLVTVDSNPIGTPLCQVTTPFRGVFVPQ